MEFHLPTLEPIQPLHHNLPTLTLHAHSKQTQTVTEFHPIEFYPAPDPVQAQPQILSWDTFLRPPAQPVPPYQSPYPIESSTQVWDLLLQATSSTDQHTSWKPSWPIERASALCARLYLGLNLSDEDNQPRITGLSAEASQAVFSRARQFGTNLGKIESVQGTGLLASGLELLAVMLRVEIAAASERSKQLTLGRQTLLEPINALLEGLSTALVKSRTTDVDDIYQFTDYILGSGALPILQAVASWLLDRVTVRILVGWETWLGLVRDTRMGRDRAWPSEYDELYQRLWDECGIECVKDRHQEDVEDEKSREVRYSLKLERVPKFMPAEVAERLFEAGIALRILRKSGVEERWHGRPVCLLHPIRTEERSRWVWSAEELRSSQVALSKQARNIYVQTSAWRNHVELLGPVQPADSHPKSQIREPPWVSDRLEELEELLKRITLGFRPDGHSAHSAELISVLEDRLRHFSPPTLLKAMEIPSLSILTQETVFKPLEARADAINDSLLSFFLVDMDLLDHLHILGNFFFCFDLCFVQRLSKALFEPSELHATTTVVGVSPRLMDKARWPPSGFDLSSALRTVILDSIPSTSASAALNELEDRLSFATREEDWTGAPPESVQAFDFLCLDFKPPPGLRPVISEELLVEYRSVNMYLMKLVRLQAIMRVVRHSLRALNKSSHTLAILVSASQRLLDGIVSFTWDIALGSNWRSFIDELTRTRARILERERWPVSEEEGEEEKGQGIRTVEELKGLHWAMVSEMKNNMFLRNRQRTFASTLEQAVFEPILQLGTMLSGREIDEVVIEDLGKRQRKAVSKLVKALERLSERAADRAGTAIGAGFLGEFVGRVDWNRFYADWYDDQGLIAHQYTLCYLND
ncbi:hypothetical protein CROQUDRAFT_88174 [Cronartium quercuum f. sp. fusiforme G11]|uniref:Gamma tubulin complex component C-terminal domain-containing protein n=1 Tax=Cronartium quercuum f. sp. fusiforme G11 TaxID=708437 RepID=A0A9P6NNF2_9BASI|nr:hypothetical protein CROQUDRAFT_88174 [Cronartium quercuum f. sp. fusiforme G11]